MDIQEAISEFKMENALLGVRNPMKVARNDLAISALQEQAEREKGCEYCEQVITTVKMNFETDSILGESKWFSSTRSPKFCPMCGRRLK